MGKLGEIMHDCFHVKLANVIFSKFTDTIMCGTPLMTAHDMTLFIGKSSPGNNKEMMERRTQLADIPMLMHVFIISFHLPDKPQNTLLCSSGESDDLEISKFDFVL